MVAADERFSAKLSNLRKQEKQCVLDVLGNSGTRSTIYYVSYRVRIRISYDEYRSKSKGQLYLFLSLDNFKWSNENAIKSQLSFQTCYAR